MSCPTVRRRKKTAAQFAASATLGFETLEVRLPLTADALLSPLDPGHLTIDTDAYDPESILVRFRDGLLSESTGCDASVVAAGRAGDTIERALGGVTGLRQIRVSQGSSIDAALAAYQNDPRVLYAEPNYQMQMIETPNDPRYSELWGLNNEGQTGGTLDVDIDAPEAWDVPTVGSTLVAVIDTGVDYTHPDLAANMWVNPGEVAGDGIDNDGNGFVDDVHGYDFVNHDPDPMDDQGHGTHVAGTIGAVGNNGIGVTGVNWNVQLMAVKFLDATGNGTTADAVDAINYAAEQGATISNNSWGGYEPFSQAMYDAIAAAGDAGQVFVAGAGNGYFGFPLDIDAYDFFPASYDLDNIISVAATDDHDRQASFSNYGAISVDLAAPGVDILSTRPNNHYEKLSGTSMATPHVAGVASLIRDLHPTWTYSEVVQQILSTVDPIDSMQGITVTGGRLNAASALGHPVPPPPPPPSGNLPILEDFNDDEAEYFAIHEGSWTVQDGLYHAIPTVNAISTIRIADPLPADFELQAVVNADPAENGLYSNAFVIFDYQSDTDYKFAGPQVASDKWVIGHRYGSNWIIDASVVQPVDALTDYQLQVTIEDGTQATLWVDGVARVSQSYTGGLTDGDVGLSTWNAIARFDDVVVQAYTPPPPPPAATLPVFEDFEDDLADYLDTQSGFWQAAGGRYHATPSGDAISTWRVADTLPTDLDLRATINADAASGGLYGNAFIVFDYQSNTDFKFAGAYVASGKWAIGHRSGTKWVMDASTQQSISPTTDYALQVVIEDNSDVTLLVDGVAKASRSYQGSLSDGEVGLATWNAIARFDDVSVQQYLPPPPPPSGTLPLLEDFDDDQADFFESRTGLWSVSDGRYHATPDADAISTLRLSDPLPVDLDLRAVVNADPASGGLYSNAYVVFDYQSDTDFKFAGASLGAGKWVIGHRSGSSWVTDASINESIQSMTDYALQVVIEADRNVKLLVNGAEKTHHTFADSLTDGELGLATWNAFARFDDVSANSYQPPPPPPSGTLPVVEDFADDQADFFEVRSGSWSVSDGRYHATPNGDAVSTLRVSDLLPPDLDLQTVINADPVSGGLYSNAYLVFDYQSDTDFKFAGAALGSGKWVIGHRSGSSWVTDASRIDTINNSTDYSLRVILKDDSNVTLIVDGVTKLNHNFAASITDGPVGLATWNAVSHFDDVLVQPYVSGVAITSPAGVPGVGTRTVDDGATLLAGPTLQRATPRAAALELSAQVIDHLFVDHPSRKSASADAQGPANVAEFTFGEVTDTWLDTWD